MSKFKVNAQVVGTLDYELAVSANSDMSDYVTGPTATAAGGFITVESPVLAAGNWYWSFHQDGMLLEAPRGQANTWSDDPVVSTQRIMFGTCADSGSDHSIFNIVQSENPLFFAHMGDMHYEDLTSTDPQDFINAINEAWAQNNQGNLYTNVPLLYIMDDHDCGGGNDPPGNTPTMEASFESYRKRIPHPDTPLTGATDGVYFHVDIGRVRYIFTDQRRYSSPKEDTDDANKTILGATQKAWFKDLIENSPGKLIVWFSARCFHANKITGHDSWGGFTTERTELCNHIRDHASGRVIVCFGDRHECGWDDGTNCNYADTSDPIVAFMASPLDQVFNDHGKATFSEPAQFIRGVAGTLRVEDPGTDTLEAVMALRRASGGNAWTHTVFVNVGNP